jgi:hypothetical protein
VEILAFLFWCRLCRLSLSPRDHLVSAEPPFADLKYIELAGPCREAEEPVSGRTTYFVVRRHGRFPCLAPNPVVVWRVTSRGVRYRALPPRHRSSESRAEFRGRSSGSAESAPAAKVARRTTYGGTCCSRFYKLSSDCRGFQKAALQSVSYGRRSLLHIIYTK